MLRFISVLFGLLFGGVFAGAGIFISMQTSVPMFRNYQEAKEWPPVPARLLSVSGDDSSTKASYQYLYDGGTYQNDRVYIAGFNDNIGSYHSELQAKLNRLYRAGTPVNVYVNPQNPADSVLDKSMRWGMFTLTVVFCSVFILIGLLVMVSSFFAKPKRRQKVLPNLLKLRKEWKAGPESRESFVSFLEKRRSQLLVSGEEDPVPSSQVEGVLSQDWQGRKGWERNAIRSDAQKGTIGIWFFALLWNGISYTIAIMLLADWRQQEWGALVVLIFPLAGLLLLYHAVKRSLELKRFGVVVYEMDPYPGAIGGHVGGRLKINNLRELSASYTVLVECVYSYVSGSGKNRSRKERIEWAEKGHPKAAMTANGMSLDFVFTVPEDLPEAEIEQSGNYYFWRLTVQGDLPGIDLDRSYNIPVFATGELCRSSHRDISRQVMEGKKRESEVSKAAIARGHFDETALARSMRIKREGRGILLIFPMFRNKVLTLIALLFGGGFGFATISIISGFSGSGLFSIFAYLFVIPFAIVAFLGTVIGIYMPLNNLRVRIENRQVTVLRRLFFIPIYYKKVEKGEVTSLTTKRMGSTGQGVNKIEHFKIHAHLKDGATITVAEGVDGADLAEQFAGYLKKAIRNC